MGGLDGQDLIRIVESRYGHGGRGAVADPGASCPLHPGREMGVEGSFFSCFGGYCNWELEMPLPLYNNVGVFESSVVKFKIN